MNVMMRAEGDNWCRIDLFSFATSNDRDAPNLCDAICRIALRFLALTDALLSGTKYTQAATFLTLRHDRLPRRDWTGPRPFQQYCIAMKGSTVMRGPQKSDGVYLSKSKLLSWLQCPRRLYLEIYQPKLADESEAAKATMAAGNLVGEKAREFFPSGVLIDWPRDASGRDQAVQQTAQHLIAKSPRPIFEATFAHERTLVRADLLLPEKRRWNLVEVKSSTSVKDYHLFDTAIQSHVLQASGVKLGDVAIVTINNKFIYPGKGCYQEIKRNGEVNSLFQSHDVTRESAALAEKEAPAWIAGARKTLAGKLPAKITTCNKPYPCPFIDHCYPQTTEFSVDLLPGIGKKADELRAQGYEDIRDIPDGILINKKQEWVRRVTIAGKHDLLPGAAAILRKHGYPRYYIDFETIGFAMPIWKGTRPYQQIPFQWSCHIEKKDGSLKHQSFLDTSGDDPTRALAESLIKAVGRSGPIYVYNQSFEEGRINELALRYRDLAPALESIVARLFDLLPLTREYYYHPEMKGSWSIKAVLPTVAPDLDYSNLAGAQNGGQAQDDYLTIIDPKTDSARREELRKGLLVYCGRDTEAMLKLVSFLTCAPSVARAVSPP